MELEKDQNQTESKGTKSLEEEKASAIKVIESYDQNFTGFEDSWREVIGKAQIDILKELATAVQEFFKSCIYESVAPLHIAAVKGSLKLCEYIIMNTTNKNPLSTLHMIEFRDAKSDSPFVFSK